MQFLKGKSVYIFLHVTKGNILLNCLFKYNMNEAPKVLCFWLLVSVLTCDNINMDSMIEYSLSFGAKRSVLLFLSLMHQLICLCVLVR